MTIFIVVATALVITLLLLFRRRGVSPTRSATVYEIPAIVSHLAR